MSALLAIWHDVDPSVRDDYTAWYDEEHFPERLSVPGFLNGQRFEALDDATRPTRLAFYEVESLAVLAGGEYRRRLERPTPRTTQVISGFRNSIRGACTVLVDRSAAHGVHGTQGTRGTRGTRGTHGTYCATIELRADASHDLLDRAITALCESPGVVRARVIEGDPAATGPMTAEQRLRGAPDDAVGRVAIIETDNEQALQQLDALTAIALTPARRYRRLRFAEAAQYQAKAER